MYILVYFTSRMYVHNVYTSLFNQQNVRSQCIYQFISPVECTCTMFILVYFTSRMYVHNVYTSLFNQLMYVHNVYTSLFHQQNVRALCIYQFISPGECTCTMYILVYLTSRMYVHNVYSSLFHQQNVRAQCIYQFI